MSPASESGHTECNNFFTGEENAVSVELYYPGPGGSATEGRHLV